MLWRSVAAVTATTAPQPNRRIALIAASAIVLSALNLRALVTALPPLLPRIDASLGLSGVILGVIGMAPTVTFALAALSSPWMLRRFTSAQTLCMAMLATATGQLLRVLGPSTLLLLAGTFFGLFAIGITNAVIPVALRAFFPRRVPQLSIVYMVCMQIGMMSAPLFSEPLAESLDGRGGIAGWQFALGVWLIPALIAAAAWSPLLGLARSKAAAEAAKRRSSLPVHRTSIGRGLVVMFGMTSFSTFSFMLFIPQMYIDGGASVHFAALMLSYWSGLGLLLSIVGPWIAARLRDPFPVVALCLLCFIVGNVGMALHPMSAPWLWITLSGVGPLSFPTALTLVNLRARTTAGATALSSFGQGGGYTIAAVGPLLFGTLHDATSSWIVPVGMTVIATVLVGIGTFFATRNTDVETQLGGVD
ncbi:putative transporter YycB [Corynebacterium ciconiae DSM 44920]|nr:putative transporter YycB [Corynebacterium ciconiae DSM 44920]